MNENQNVYFQARKKAAAYNERLWSREGAAELLGISASTLADYELGNTKVVPVDKVVLMADLYKTPELITGYCMRECPVHGFLLWRWLIISRIQQPLQRICSRFAR